MGWQPSTAPLLADEVAAVQSEIDSIIGLTRDNKQILKLVWNGDRAFWEELYMDWDLCGKPVRTVKRPLVLYKSILNEDGSKLIRDVFVPRWLLLQRSEPETYARTWEQYSYMTSPKLTEDVWEEISGAKVLVKRPRKILFRPPVPPKDGWYRKFQTIARHENGCCQEAAKLKINCFGEYAHPKHAFADLRMIADARKRDGVREQPFATPREVHREIYNGDNNYINQAAKTFDRKPLVLAR